MARYHCSKCGSKREERYLERRKNRWICKDPYDRWKPCLVDKKLWFTGKKRKYRTKRMDV